ncbi:MAG: response regulator transcription factor, partial [Candidatus Omnitrophica bacterium]|nr:response regulator transcription factor [Candidatus Omnitrophota bacterium]
MHRVLFISGDPAGKKPLKSGLLEQGFGVSMVQTQELLKESFAPGKADMVVVDLERSPAEPRKICHAIKRDRTLKELPLVLLVTEEQLGRLDFSWGVDDYLTLPVSVKRLSERIRFLMWKLNKIEGTNGLKLGDLTMDFERYEVHVDGAPVDLTYKEFELLKFLATHPGRVFSREALLDKVWGYDYYGGTRTVDVHVRRLRSKIETGSRVY